MKVIRALTPVVQVTAKTKLKTVCPICGSGGNTNCTEPHMIGGHLEYMGWVHAERVKP